MDPKYKTIIPLVIVFFVFGVAIGYVAHKQVTIEKIVNVTVTPVPTPSPTLTTPIPPPSPTPTPTPTTVATPAVPAFTVKNYEPSKDAPAKTIELTSSISNSWEAIPNEISIKPGDAVLIKITGNRYGDRLIFILNETYSKDLGTSGAVFITFNNKGKYSFKTIVPSSDPNIVSRTYTAGTITIY